MGLSRTRGALRGFAEFSEDTTCAIAIAPPVFAVHTDRAAPTMEAFGVDGELDLRRPAREVIKVLSKDIPALDLGPPLEAAAPHQALYFVYDGHWNAAGHALVAEQLASFLDEAVIAP